jgi:YbbR domain-containing protein
MKKHVIGRVPAHKEPVGKRISELHIPARIFCFLLAVILWLAITALSAPSANSEQPSNQAPTEEHA